MKNFLTYAIIMFITSAVSFAVAITSTVSGGSFAFFWYALGALWLILAGLALNKYNDSNKK